MTNLCIQTITEQFKNISWETIIAVIGALAWIPWVYDKFTPSKLYGSIISNFTNQGRFNTKSGTMHFLKLSISCINKNFNVSECSIEIKYLNNDEIYHGNIFWARTSRWSMDPQGTIHKNLIIPNEEFLGFVNMFEKDKSVFYYLTFIVEKATLEEFEVINITFKNPKGKKRSIEFKNSDINPDKVLFDDNIWQ
jgi:hypothetical protein